MAEVLALSYIDEGPSSRRLKAIAAEPDKPSGKKQMPWEHAHGVEGQKCHRFCGKDCGRQGWVKMQMDKENGNVSLTSLSKL